MVNYKYALEGYNLYWGDKETTFNTHSNTTTNTNTDNFYWFPCEHQNKIAVKRVRKRYHRHISGYVDEGSTGHEGYEPLMITLEGPMWNLDMLYFLCKHADNSGASAPYTHDTITSDARLHDCTFPIFGRQQNDGADVLKL